MKLKLAALLFSQAAVQAVRVDRNNFRENLCDDSFFTHTKEFDPIHPPQLKVGRDTDELNAIIWKHKRYCSDMENYQKELENKKTGFRSSDSHAPGRAGQSAADMYIEMAGIKLAETCGDLKYKKESHSPRGAWDAAVPNLSCPKKYPAI